MIRKYSKNGFNEMCDIIETKYKLFNIFTCKQEYEGKKDKHGRFLYRFSNYKDVLKPVVSEYLTSNGFLDVEWPENYRFAACLTHDIDTLYPSWKYTLFTATKFALKLKFNDSLGRITTKLKKDRTHNPYWNFRNIMKLEEKYSAKSTFFFKTTYKDPAGWKYSARAS